MTASPTITIIQRVNSPQTWIRSGTDGLEGGPPTIALWTRCHGNLTDKSRDRQGSTYQTRQQTT